MSNNTNNECVNCGQDCCFDVRQPRRIECQQCCYGCCEVDVKLPPDYCIKAGDALGAIQGDENGVGGQPMTYKRFNEMATDGTQYPVVIAKYDAQTDSRGRIKYSIWGCGDFVTKAYACGTFRASDLQQDYRKLSANGMPVRYINGMIYFG
jgi:hypothetical protein